MFDLTKEIKLSEKGEKIYRILRALIYAFSFLGAVYFAYIILFPTAYFTFSFINPNSMKNTIINPRVDNDQIPKKGNLESDKEMFFETSLAGGYSKVIAEFVLAEKSDLISEGKASIRKSYQSFFYPEGMKIDYNQEADNDGIIDGELVAYGESVYIISQDRSFPINNIKTFVMHGYSWDDLKKVGPDVIADYEKQKLFSLSSPHPNGTILKTDGGKYYLIRDEKKLPISEKSIGNLPERSPIAVSEGSLEMIEACTIKNHPIWKKVYSCEMPIEKFEDLIGLDFQFKTNFKDDVKLDYINVRFKKEFSFKSLKNTISTILSRTKDNYTQ